MDSIDCGTTATNPWRLTPTSGSLLSEPSTVKLLDLPRAPLTENWPALPMPNPTPGPRTPGVYGGGETPGTKNANSSNDRMVLPPPSGNVHSCRLVKFPPRAASVLFTRSDESLSFLRGACGAVFVGVGVG